MATGKHSVDLGDNSPVLVSVDDNSSGLIPAKDKAAVQFTRIDHPSVSITKRDNESVAVSSRDSSSLFVSKSDNSSVVIRPRPGAGLGVFAARRICAGEVVMTEAPIVAGPKQAAPPVACVECFRAVRINGLSGGRGSARDRLLGNNGEEIGSGNGGRGIADGRCARCGVPLCANCVTHIGGVGRDGGDDDGEGGGGGGGGAFHTRRECALLSGHRILVSDPLKLHSFLTPLRFLLK